MHEGLVNNSPAFSCRRGPGTREAYANGRMFDISHRVAKDLSSWDSKDGLGRFLFPLASIKNGSDVNASEMKMSVHAMSHMFDNYCNAGFDADSLDLQVLNCNPKSCPFFFFLNSLNFLMYIFVLVTAYVHVFVLAGPALLVDVPIRDRNIAGKCIFVGILFA